MAALDRALRPCLRLCLATTLAMTGSALAAASAGAATSWVTSPEPVASSLLLRGAPVVGIDEAGESTELWNSQGEGEAALLESSTRPAGGAWTPAVTVPSEGHPEEPVLGVNAEGEATAAWIDYPEGDSPQVFSSQRAPGGAWGPAVRLSSGVARLDLHGLTVVVGSGGAAVVAWYEHPEGEGQWVEVNTRQGSSWRGPERISYEGGARANEHPVLASNGNDGFIAIWAEAEYETNPPVYSITADELRDGVWQGDQTLMSGNESLGEPNLAENAAGEATALWLNFVSEEIDSARLRGGQWKLGLLQGGSADNSCKVPMPQVGIDAAGDSTAAWVDTAGDVFTATLPSRGEWTGISRLTEFPESTVGQEASLSEDPTGDAALVWSRYDYGLYRRSVEGTYRRAGQAWEAPDGISPVGGNLSEPSLAMDARGDALTSWGVGLYEPNGLLSFAYVGDQPASTPAKSPAGGPAGSSATITPTPGLAPVYLVLPRSRLHLPHGSHMVTATIRNRNPFPVTGTATMSWFTPAPAGGGGAHTARSHAKATSTAIATVAHFSLPGDSSGRVHFRLSPRALRRLFAYVPDAGHDLVSIRLAVQGADGQHSSGETVYALDAPPTRPGRRPHRHGLVVPPGYRAPVDPWVRAHAAC